MALGDPKPFYPLITGAAAATGLDWWLLYGVIEQESGFDPRAESGCGALGLMQLMPESFPAWSRSSLLEPASNVRLGADASTDRVRYYDLYESDLAAPSLSSGVDDAELITSLPSSFCAAGNSCTWRDLGPNVPQIVAGHDPYYGLVAVGQNGKRSTPVCFQAGGSTVSCN